MDRAGAVTGRRAMPYKKAERHGSLEATRAPGIHAGIMLQDPKTATPLRCCGRRWGADIFGIRSDKRHDSPAHQIGFKSFPQIERNAIVLTVSIFYHIDTINILQYPHEGYCCKNAVTRPAGGCRSHTVLRCERSAYHTKHVFFVRSRESKYPDPSNHYIGGFLQNQHRLYLVQDERAK